MINLLFVEAGFVWGLIISILILAAIIALVVLVLRKKKKPVTIDVVKNEVETQTVAPVIVLSKGRTYSVGNNNKVKAGEYTATFEGTIVITLNGVNQEIKNEEVVTLADGDSIHIDGGSVSLKIKK